MARRRAPENETQDQADQRREREVIANHATRSEKVSWERQFNNMQKLLTDELQPIESQILDLMVKKNEVFDRISTLRSELVDGCIHPFEHLELLNGLGDDQYPRRYECKFCGKRLIKNDASEQ